MAICGHVNAFTKTKQPKLVPVEHGEAYTSQTDFEDAISKHPKPPRDALTKEETIWKLFLDFITGQEVDKSDAEYKGVDTARWRGTSLGREKEDEVVEARSPREEDILLGLVPSRKAKM